MIKILLFTTLLAITLSITIPVFNQCDEQWAKELIGTSSTETICSSGSLITSVAMGLKAIGKDYNPSNLNQWLKNNRGYIGNTLFVWASINSIGLVFQGYGVSQIRASFDKGRIVLVEVKGTGDWTIMTGHDNYTIFVNDPKKGATSYEITALSDGNSGIYIAPNYEIKQSSYNWANKLFSRFLTELFVSDDLSLSQNVQVIQDISTIQDVMTEPVSINNLVKQ